MFNEERHFEQPIRWAMAGGGRGSEIGYAHRSAAQRDGLFRLVAGAFDIDPARGREFGTNLGVAPQRCYADYREMFAAEAQRSDGIQAVSIATPNATHYEISLAALEAGLHVICEKPVTFRAREAEQLQRLARERDRVFGVMYGYSGFPMLHQAREMIRRGELGDIRILNLQFAHGFHCSEIEKHSPGARWRMNPEVSGPSFVLGDLGTHAWFLAGFLTSLEVERLCCMRQSFIASRAPLEDNAHVMLQFRNGAVGTLWASAVNAGSMHQQKVRIVGEKASLEWWDEYPNQLRYEVQGEPARVLERGMDYLHKEVPGVATSRIGGGHAEGFFESWANLYHRFALAMNAKDCGDAADRATQGAKAAERGDREMLNGLWYPDIDAGLDGVRWLERCVESADNGACWVDY